MSHSLVSYSFDILFLELCKNLKDFWWKVDSQLATLPSIFVFFVPNSSIFCRWDCALQMANFDDNHSVLPKMYLAFLFLLYLICKQRKQQPRTLSQAQLGWCSFLTECENKPRERAHCTLSNHRGWRIGVQSAPSEILWTSETHQCFPALDGQDRIQSLMGPTWHKIYILGRELEKVYLKNNYFKINKSINPQKPKVVQV